MLTRHWFLTAALVAALPACGNPGGESYLDQSQLAGSDASGKADANGNVYYYAARRDLRKCASPMCGGYFVKNVNFSSTRCADGTYAAECYVASADFDKLGLSDTELDTVGTALSESRALIRGSLSTQKLNGTKYGKLVATEAWTAATTNPAKGYFNRALHAPKQCITTPCPQYTIAYVNTKPSTVSVADFDWKQSGASQDQIDNALAQMDSTDGAIVAGYYTSRPKLGGLFTDYQVYTRLVHQVDGQFCGGFGGLSCPKGYMCDLEYGTCGAADQGGVCKKQSDFCTEIYKPVCGCDDTTYSNDCFRVGAGVSKLHDGACETTPAPKCQKSGCSGQVCSDKLVITTCLYEPWYECYQAATCEAQADGNCGWTESDALTTCLAKYGL